MSNGLFSDLTTRLLIKSLDCCGLRQRVIANNIANVETPGFKRSQVSFETKLHQVLTTSDEQLAEKQIESLSPEITVDTESPARPNGNNVSVEKEMVDMAKNSMQYETLIQLLNLKSAMIRAAMTDGRR